MATKMQRGNDFYAIYLEESILAQSITIYGILKKFIYVNEKSVRWIYVICGTFIALTCCVFPQYIILEEVNDFKSTLHFWSITNNANNKFHSKSMAKHIVVESLQFTRLNLSSRYDNSLIRLGFLNVAFKLYFMYLLFPIQI